MAGLETTGYDQDPLYVSPDNLMIDHEFENSFGREQQQHEHPSVTHIGQATPISSRSVSFTEQQRPGLSLPAHSISGWQIPTQASFRPALPPTPISPFRPLRTLTEEEKLAFPCLGGPDDCWNTSLCPKHRQEPVATSRESSSSELSQLGNLNSQRPPPNPRRRSCPVDNSQGPPTAKIKRHATEPEENDIEMHHHHSRHRQHDRTISRDSTTFVHCQRTSHSRGRVPHNLVERRYRDNLNHQIESLRLTLPSLRDAIPPTDDFDASSPRMPSKAVIISTAATYIKDMENERARLLDANKALQEQVASLQKLMRCGAAGGDFNIVQYLNAMRLTAGQLPTPS